MKSFRESNTLPRKGKSPEMEQNRMFDQQVDQMQAYETVLTQKDHGAGFAFDNLLIETNAHCASV